MEPLRHLANFVSDLTYEKLPQSVRRAALGCILDTVSVGAGAAKEDQLQSVTAQLLSAFGRDPVSTLWGQGQKAPLASAVFLNAMASHTLELDDVHTASKTHIGTVVIPAAWALAEQLGCSGTQLITAVTAGYEAAARIGMAFGVVSHRKHGWHATGTAGVFGAGAACASLLGLSKEQTLYAFALSGAQASGVWAFLGDGSSCKALNPARAAVNGCTAAYLSKAGMSGPEHILTAQDGGLFGAMTDEPIPDQVDSGLGQKWEILQLDKKPYPCCRSTHCVIDGILALRKAHSIPVDQVRQVTVETYEVGYQQCGVSESSLSPKTPAQAKFSTPYTAAVALATGNVTLSDFAPEAIFREDIRSLMPRIQVISSPHFSRAYPGSWGCCVHILMSDGTQYSQIVSDASGSVANPQSEQQLKDKADSLFARASVPLSKNLSGQLLSLAQLPTLPEL